MIQPPLFPRPDRDAPFTPLRGSETYGNRSTDGDVQQESRLAADESRQLIADDLRGRQSPAGSNPADSPSHVTQETRREGRARNRPRAARQCLRILEALQAGPLTRHQLHTRTGISLTSLCGRIGELKARDQIVALDKVPGPFLAANVRYRLTEAT